MIKAKAEGNTLTLNIHGSIGSSWWKSDDREDGAVEDVEDLQKIINKNKDAAKIDIYINSMGGDVSEGIAIYNILKRTRAYKRVFIDGFACSIASVIAMAGNSIEMPKSSMQMIHNAWSCAVGNANELRKMADDLDKINETIIAAYMSKFNGSEEKLRDLLDGETYLTAKECLDYGLCTKIVDDSETTEENVDEGLEQTVTVMENKLKMLESIKNAIRDLNAETDNPEVVNEPKGETAKERKSVNEAIGAKNAKENAKKEFEAMKDNALQKFFGYTEKGEE